MRVGITQPFFILGDYILLAIVSSSQKKFSHLMQIQDVQATAVTDRDTATVTAAAIAAHYYSH